MAFTRAAKRKHAAEEEEKANNGQPESSARTKRTRQETAGVSSPKPTTETHPSELAILRARVQELEAREDANNTEIAALKGTLQSSQAEIAFLQGKVTLLTDKREKWRRVWDAITDTREVMMTELSELRAEQRQLGAQIDEDLVGVASVLNTCADLQLKLTLRHRAMMDQMEMVMDTATGLASDSAFRDSVLAEKVARIQEVIEDQAKKTDELLALSRPRQL